MTALDPSTTLATLFHDPETGGAAAQVTRLLICSGAASGAEIAERTGLSRASISTALADLRARGVVVETAVEADDTATRGRGRPQMSQSVTPGIGHAAGVLFGLRELRVMLSDANHATLEACAIPMPIDYGPKMAITVLQDALGAMAARQGIGLDALLGIGLAIAAPISPGGRVERSSIVRNWAGLDLAQTFAPAFPCPVHADNESNCAARAKMLWGEARGLKDFIYVILDFGIGGAIVSNGRVLRGADGFAAEFGHMPVDHPGRPCRCGKSGCLETLATVDVVLDTLAQARGRTVSLVDLERLLASGDKDAQAAVAQAGVVSGRALALISSVLSPGHYVLDGILTRLGAAFLDPLRRAFADDIRGHLPEIITGDNHADDTLRGAVALVFCRKGRLG